MKGEETNPSKRVDDQTISVFAFCFKFAILPLQFFHFCFISYSFSLGRTNNNWFERTEEKIELPMSALEYQIGPVDGASRDHGETDLRNVHAGLSRLPGDRWIHHSVSANQCILTDNNNTEVVLILSTAAPRLGAKPPTIFIDSCVVDDASDTLSNRIIVFICIAHTDNDGINRGKVQKLELEFDNRCESPLAPLIDYNAGMCSCMSII